MWRRALLQLLLLLPALLCGADHALASRPVITQIALFGTMHSGSNLLENMYLTNFRARVHMGAHTGWKHTPPDEACAGHALMDLNTTLVVSIARDPLSYFERLFYDSYELMYGYW